MSNKSVVYRFDLVKREAGVSPARARRCKKGVRANCVTGEEPGRPARIRNFKSEDLPVIHDNRKFAHHTFYYWYKRPRGTGWVQKRFAFYTRILRAVILLRTDAL